MECQPVAVTNAEASVHNMATLAEVHGYIGKGVAHFISAILAFNNVTETPERTERMHANFLRDYEEAGERFPRLLQRLSYISTLRAMGMDADEARSLLDAGSVADFDGPPRAADTTLACGRVAKVLETTLHGVGDGTRRAMK